MKTLQQVEPRTPIGPLTTPGNAFTVYRITQSGSYYLTENLVGVANKDGIVVDAPNVTIDLMGFAVEGSAVGASQYHGIRFDASSSNGRVHNGRVLNWPGIAINAEETAGLHVADMLIDGGAAETGVFTADRSLIERCRIRGKSTGITCGNDGVIRDCIVLESGGNGIELGSRAILERTAIRANGQTGVLMLGSDARVEDCDIEGSIASGVRIQTNSRSIVRNNRVTNNGIGLDILTSSNIVSDNIVRGNIDNYAIAANNQVSILLCEIPEIIDWSGNVRMVGSLTGVSGQPGITINASNVTIDLAGHSLIGVAGSLHGIGAILQDVHNIRILNGVVTSWGGTGITLRGIGHHVESVHARSNLAAGMQCGSNAVIQTCTAASNGTDGITVGTGASIQSCVSQNNGSAGIYVLGQGTLSHCRSSTNASGIFLGSGSTASNCVAESNSIVGIWGGVSCHMADCVSRLNSVVGYSFSTHASLSACSAFQNGTHGIDVSSFAHVIGCASLGNGTMGDGSGILVRGFGGRIEGNHCANNDRGIDIDIFGNTISRNTCRSNTINYDIAVSNYLGPIVVTPASAAVVGSAGGAGLGSTDPSANFAN